MTLRHHCRVCGHAPLAGIIDLGSTPLADRLLHRRDEPVMQYPLRVLLCESCGLAQLADTVAPDSLFNEDYPYLSSTSRSWLEHCRRHASTLIGQLGLDRDSLVIEPASNDGYMLHNFHAAGIPVLGIEPSLPPYEAAQRAGIPTRRGFLDMNKARELAAEGIRADLVIANNVLAHVPEPLDFARAMALLLSPRGVISIEVPDLVELVERCAFDTIYHQHICYFSLTALVNLFERAGLTVRTVERLPTHGGSLRVIAATQGTPESNVADRLREESALGIARAAFYAGFRRRVGETRDRLRELFDRLHSHGKRIAGYGAAAKATTLLAYCGVTDRLEYLVDRNEYKIGRYFPVGALPICSPDQLRREPPDALLLLAWNLENEIREQLHSELQQGLRLIVPVPPERMKEHHDD